MTQEQRIDAIKELGKDLDGAGLRTVVLWAMMSQAHQRFAEWELFLRNTEAGRLVSNADIEKLAPEILDFVRVAVERKNAPPAGTKL